MLHMAVICTEQISAKIWTFTVIKQLNLWLHIYIQYRHILKYNIELLALLTVDLSTTCTVYFYINFTNTYIDFC
jgi:hypothetical protein